jgi:hypothetical protein
MQHCLLEKMFYFIIIFLVDKMTGHLIINNAKNLYNYLILQKVLALYNMLLYLINIVVPKSTMEHFSNGLPKSE